jgi:transcriptional regulator with XRE-family HTH domain
MSSVNDRLHTFLKELMERRHRLPSQLAVDLGVSHATVSRWLSGQDKPSPQSCRSLAEYSSVPVEKVLAIVGHLPPLNDGSPSEWPEFREYARGKYPGELDDDLVMMIESLIEHRRRKNASNP